MKEFFATNRLSAYIDGQLSDAEMAEVEKSIRENPSVRSEYNRMLHAVELVRTQGPLPVPEGFRERLEARLALERAPKPRLNWLPAPLRRLPIEAIGLAMPVGRPGAALPCAAHAGRVHGLDGGVPRVGAS